MEFQTAKRGSWSAEAQLLSETATGGLWGSFAQIASVLGMVGVGAGVGAGVVAGTSAALKVSSATADDGVLPVARVDRRVEVAEEDIVEVEQRANATAQHYSSRSSNVHYSSSSERKAPTIRGVKVVDRNNVPEEDIIWLTEPPAPGTDGSSVRIVGSVIKEDKSAESEAKINAHVRSSMKAAIERQRSNYSKYSERQLLERGFKRVSKNSFAKLVQLPSIKVKVDATETITKVRTDASAVSVTTVEVVEPRVVWETKSYHLLQPLYGKPQLETETVATFVEKEVRPVEMISVSPQKKVKKVITKRVEQQPQCVSGNCYPQVQQMQMAPVIMQQPQMMCATGNCTPCAGPQCMTETVAESAAASSMVDSAVSLP